MKPIRLIAMDMDGTLLNSRQELTAPTVSALRQAAQRGVKLAICSGRSPGDNALFALDNGLTDCAILALNGAYCLERPGAAPFLNRVMDDAAARQCVAWMRELDITFGVYLQNRIAQFYSARREPDFFWNNHENVPGAPEYVYDWNAFQSMWSLGVNKILCLEPEDAILTELQNRVQTLPGLEITSSWPQDIEIMAGGVSKGSAVGMLAAQLGLGPEQVMAAGDYDNDLSMIRYAGLGVAMGNAAPCVKAAAQYITLPNDQDGVADAIRRFVLE